MRYFAFLKAINVGGHTVTMERLRTIVASLGCRNVETFIASGNVIFDSPARSARSLEAKLASGLGDALGYPVPVFLRTRAELAAVAAHQAFPPEVVASAVVVNVGFLDAPLSGAALEALATYNSRLDRFHSSGREFYWLSRTRQSESPFFKVRFERVFGADVTMRNMNTVRRLLDRYPS